MQHLAVIMDGNGRWAEIRGLPRSDGHKKGAQAFISALNDFAEMPFNYLTVYAFSTENNTRNKNEVSNILDVIAYFLINNVFKIALEKKFSIEYIGNLEELPNNLQNVIASTPKIESKKKVIIALNYGGINEICRACKKIQLSRKEINENSLLNALDTSQIPNPDAVLRYGGYKRLSNFLPIQTIYSELFFIDKLWPDYHKEDFWEVYRNFVKIKRNFGGNNA